MKIKEYTRRAGRRTKPLASKRGGLPLCICEARHHKRKRLELQVIRGDRWVRVRIPSDEKRAESLGLLVQIRDLFLENCPPPQPVKVRGYKRKEKK